MTPDGKKIYVIDPNLTQEVLLVKILDDGSIEFEKAEQYEAEIARQIANAYIPKIPTGFSYKEGSVAEGYVISDGINEFVWIPVENIENYKKKLGEYNIIIRDDGTAKLVSSTQQGLSIDDVVYGDEYGEGFFISSKEEEIDKVVSAGGFWVGRYEAGIENTSHDMIPGDSLNSEERNASLSDQYWEERRDEIVVSYNKEPVRSITWEKAAEIANNWKKGEKGENGTYAFQSGLITGTQWDTMCNFIGWDMMNASCANFANCGNATSIYYTENIWHSSDCSSNWLEENNFVKQGDYKHRYIFPTGRFILSNNNNTSLKNIYDVAGNVLEMTTEIPCNKLDNHIARGSDVYHSSYNYWGTNRGCDVGWDGQFWALMGFRIVLYVEV